VSNHGTHQGEFLGIPGTGKRIRFYTVDAMRVVDGKVSDDDADRRTGRWASHGRAATQTSPGN
jgi:predicted ester cyclase